MGAVATVSSRISISQHVEHTYVNVRYHDGCMQPYLSANTAAVCMTWRCISNVPYRYGTIDVHLEADCTVTALRH
jgi:hypothetical protein